MEQLSQLKSNAKSERVQSRIIKLALHLWFGAVMATSVWVAILDAGL